MRALKMLAVLLGIVVGWTVAYLWAGPIAATLGTILGGLLWVGYMETIGRIYGALRDLQEAISLEIRHAVNTALAEEDGSIEEVKPTNAEAWVGEPNYPKPLTMEDIEEGLRAMEETAGTEAIQPVKPYGLQALSAAVRLAIEDLYTYGGATDEEKAEALSEIVRTVRAKVIWLERPDKTKAQIEYERYSRYGNEVNDWSCWNKARPDEPVFILRAKDPLFSEVVDHWAKCSERYGFHSAEKAAEAREVSRRGEAWRIANVDGATVTSLERLQSENV